MDKLLNYLKLNMKELFDNIKIVNISYNKATNSLVVKVVYRIEFNFSDNYKNELKEKIINFLAIPNLSVELKCKKSLVEKTIVVDLVKYYFNKYYASILATMQDNDFVVNIADNQVSVVVKCQDVFYTYLENKNFEISLKLFLEDNYFQQFEVKLIAKNNVNEFDDILDNNTTIFQNTNEEEFAPITYELNDVKHICGTNTEYVALASKSLTSESSNVTIAGAINYITKRSYISKRKSGNSDEKEYYGFTLIDDYGKVQCVYFPTKETLEKFESIEDKQQIAVVGDAEEFNGRLNFKVKGISSCVLPEKAEEVVEQKGENEQYIFVEPEPYINLAQATLFDVVVENKNKFLKEHDCVVFDVETTGLDATTCEMIEIGACKVRDGKIIETFSVLIKPSQPIPDQITDLTGITNEMVANCRTIKDVLQDFYKFTRNSVLVAYNIAFDYKFMYLAGAKQGYNFDNPQIDAMVLAKEKLKGIKNYKLKTVATVLDVSLENAHRAVHDAIATAEVFIKLVDSDYQL